MLEKGAYVMNTPKVFESEYRFCLLLWENEPMNCSNLAKLAKAKLESFGIITTDLEMK